MKLMRTALTGSLLLFLAACGGDGPVNPPTTTGTTTDGTTTGGTTGVPTTTGGATTGFPSTTGGTTGTTTGGTTTGGTTTGGTTTGGSTTGGGIGTISGTVTAPAGGDITGTGVGACSLADIQDNDRCDDIALAQVDSTGAYTLTGLQAEPYYVLAVKDVDGNPDTTDGNYVGFYSTDGTATTSIAVTPPQTGVNITMQVVGGGTNPTPGELTGTWTGTTTTQDFGTEQTTFEFAQSGSSVSGTLTLDGEEGMVNTDVTGSVSGSSATVSAAFDLVDQNGDSTGDTLTYTYEGTVSGTTYSGTVTLSDGTNQVQGQFSVAQSSAATAPLGKLDTELLNRMFESNR